MLFSRPVHLAKRTLLSLGNAPVSARDLQWVAETLNSKELELWSKLSRPDQRHSVKVAKRFLALLPRASKSVISGVLLHDIGKVVSNLSTPARILATLIGPRGQKFAQYHDHEKIGVGMLREINSDRETISILDGSCVMSVREAFATADNI